MEDIDTLRELLHKLINKSVTSQSLLKILSKTDLNDQQREILQKSIESVDDSVSTVKAIREQLR